MHRNRHASMLVAMLLAGLAMTAGCSTLSSLKRDLAEQPPRRQQRKDETLAAFESQRDAAQLQAALNRFREGNHAACYQQIEELVERKPQFVDARLQLAELHLSQGELDRAEEQLRAALVLAPGRADVHDCLGRVLEAGSRNQEAAKHFQTACSLDPDYALVDEPAHPAVVRTASFQAAPH